MGFSPPSSHAAPRNQMQVVVRDNNIDQALRALKRNARVSFARSKDEGLTRSSLKSVSGERPSLSAGPRNRLARKLNGKACFLSQSRGLEAKQPTRSSETDRARASVR